jgi:hypothetical protein
MAGGGHSDNAIRYDDPVTKLPGFVRLAVT